MLKTLLCLSIVWISLSCETVPDPSSKAYYISSSTIAALRKPAKECTYRYKLENAFSKLDNQTQQQAVRAGFDLWQKGNPNIVFLQRQDVVVAEIIIRFVASSEIKGEIKKSPFGLIKGDIGVLSSVKEENNAYVILLDSDFSWDSQAITRVLAYHVGIFLGMSVSEDSNSLLYPYYIKETVRLSDTDLSQIRTLYPTLCSNSCNQFLPIKFPVNESVTKSIRLDKQGTISIKASGSMVVGFWLGWSTPAGLEKGLFNFPIGDLSIDRAFNHAALIYKINNEKNWRFCGTSCEFKTDGISQCTELTLGINDKDLSDDTGAYDVTVDYK